MTTHLDADHARRFLVRRHLLAPPRGLPARVASVLRVIDTLGSLQFDPLAVPGARNHEIVLHARIGGYELGWCEQYLYGPPGRRALFEAYNKSLNILPIDELPFYRLAWDLAARRYETGVLRDRALTVSDVLAKITREGPLTTGATGVGRETRVDWHWAPTTESRAVLEALFESGRVAIATREGNRRYFDLTDRVLPARALARRVSEAESLRHRLLSRVRAIGLVGPHASAEVFIGTGGAAAKHRNFAALCEEGVLDTVRIEGDRTHRYVLRAEQDLLADAALGGAGERPAVTFVAPLDPIVWDRRMLRSLFAFDYRWEVYTPAASRKHGYYSLPILFGRWFVGRLEPRVDRASGSLVLLGVHFEADFAPLDAEGFVGAFADALDAYRRFVGATAVVWPKTKLGRALAKGVDPLLEEAASKRLPSRRGATNRPRRRSGL